ncbi:dienelactone hydrolase family protein [Natronomonas sp. EA1]|uniref:dienelactone hydrolase family protein n=1 Tax=Natronomonas sp. EA1 TaxID=3421655 RepID=UPI003EC14ACF
MEDVLVPGTRDVRASLDNPESDTVVVACPPHPQMGGKRTDTRLQAVSDALGESGTACLRFDYGEWDAGPGELADARNALAWAREEYSTIGLFGFSFGGCLALCAAAAEPDLAAVSALAPAARISAAVDAVEALPDIACPVHVLYGERDSTADWEPVVERARELGFAVEGMGADHFFVGQAPKVAARVAGFLTDHL